MPPSLTETLTRLIDISVPLHPDMPVYPGDPGLTFEAALDMSTGGPANVTLIHMGSQVGTHYDAPHHILNDGRTMENIPLDICFGPARVIAIDDPIQAIDASVLAQFDLTHCKRLLLKTRNSQYWQTAPNRFIKDYAALTGDGASYLVTQGVQLIGIDYLSIELFGSEGLMAHKALMGGGITILEGLNLAEVTPGGYTLCAFPLKFKGLDGAPTRAVLIEEIPANH